MQISVIICTHNPRLGYLARTLEALKIQTLPRDNWELLLIDNASKEPLAGGWDLSWHHHARHIREDELGLTPARLRGIKESTGKLLIFVDDDNVLDNVYLERALEIYEKWPVLGCWGGAVIPEYEVEPEPWFSKYAHFLALRELNKDFWSNVHDAWQAVPFGAGDIDLVWTSPLLGLGFGVFCRMRLIHLIPKERLEFDYLLRLVEQGAASMILLKYKATGVFPVISNNPSVFLKSMLKRLTQTSQEWRHFQACLKGERLGLNIINQLKNAPMKAGSEKNGEPQ